MDKTALINAMLDAAEKKLAVSIRPRLINGLSGPSSETMVSVEYWLFVSYRYIAVGIGMYTGDDSPDDQYLFITEKHCCNDLMTGLASSCSECLIHSC